jgi:hypothetical protein
LFEQSLLFRIAKKWLNSLNTLLIVKLDDGNKLDSKIGFLIVASMLIGGFAVTFGCGLGVTISNAQESEIEIRDTSEIIAEIRLLLDQILTEYLDENFTGSSALVEEAYLENYEFIEAPLALLDVNLSEQIEIMLRGQLRDQVTGTDPDADVSRIIAEINSNLDEATALLANKTKNN